MAIPLGAENKRQVRLVIGLFVLIAIIGGRELYGTFSSPSTPSSPPRLSQADPSKRNLVSVANSNATTSYAVYGSNVKPMLAQQLGNAAPDISLHLDTLADTELVEYSGMGRNIFSAESEPVHVEAPIAPARPVEATLITPPPPPKPPAIALKYLGYSQTKDSVFQALLVHGDDIFIAKTGEIVSHHYKVGFIQPASVQVTDLTRNITQMLPLTEK